MNHTSASINIKNSIEKHDLSILIAMLVVFTHMHSSSIRKRSSSSSSSSKAMLVRTVVVIRIIVLLLDRSILNN